MELRDLVGVIEFPDLRLLMPEIIVLLTGFILFSLDLLYKKAHHRLFTVVSAAGYTLALVYITLNPFLSGSTFYHLYVRDTFSSLLQFFMILITLFVLAFAYRYYQQKLSLYREFYYILSFSLVSAMFLASSYHLITLYVALEGVSISFYILTALLRGDFNSKEGAFKYLILGGISIALASYGAAFMYLYAGSLDLKEILTHVGENRYFLVLGLVFFLIGFAIKIGAVPFHFWLPDAYQGAPTPVTAYMASVGKLAFFAPVVRIMPLIEEHFAYAWIITVSIISAMTMLYGNLVALVQKDVKRLLAYSSIAHSGYILAGIAVAKVIGLKAVLYFLVAYALMGAGAFLVLALLERHPEWQNRMEEFSGLRFSMPWVATSFMIFMFSLLGVPPTVGFVSKALIFTTLSFDRLWWLAFIMILATGISTGYYVRLVVLTFMKENSKPFQVKSSLAERIVLIVLTLSVVFLGAVPIIIWSFVSPSAEMLFKR
ncbi:MAG: NADH-quinone oxidoreductase subunit N [Hydrogenobacter thermophilus]|uniref:NADH-quinone oxidoreductase subunit N n=1 Tax=Hydrogenobacter thermophilus TaxID=940 RepID=UPI001C73E243|nr:NADH-quinone oxidoreductase subunit N [Hydrogenobacter thermophilus]QWK20150.1 MAG: NADH-quinone oxidoreductase subunit N [Hydrogenobacter thermophilus]